MNKGILAGIALMLVRDCELVGSRPASGTIKGTWGGDNAGLIADDSSAHVHIRCTFGNVHQAIVLDAAGRFDVPGDYVLRAYPVYVGPTLPARFQGSVSGKTMALSVTVQLCAFPPIVTPRNPINTGSISVSKLAIAASTSCS